MQPNAQTTLIEIRTEELPPKALPSLLQAFKDKVEARLRELQFECGTVHAYSSPRRMALVIEELSAEQPVQITERKGPMLTLAYDGNGQPTQALLGFVRSCATTLDQLQEMDTPKGKALVFRSQTPGQSIKTVLPGVVMDALKQLPIPKMMRWGDGTDSFVRPVHGVVMLYGSDPIHANLFGVEAGNTTVGHRFMAPGAITLNHPNEYLEKLAQAKVLLVNKTSVIEKAVRAMAEAQGANADMPADLLEEVANIVEWPVALLCTFDAKFLDVPQEALILAMQQHQKCFPLKDKTTGKLRPQFVVISNIESKDPAVVIRGNEKVVRARLSDAQFFYQTDLNKSLASYWPDLAKVTFHAKLGSIGEKVQRLQKLVVAIGQLAGFSAEDATLLHAKRAAELCKSDLLSSMVNEFPELQGVMGNYYAQQQGEPIAVAQAIEEHYKPRFAEDTLPESIAGMFLAIADKLDTLVGIFGVGEKPTGSKDPFALRRQTLGVLKALLSMLSKPEWQKYSNASLRAFIQQAIAGYGDRFIQRQDSLCQELLTFFTERLEGLYQMERRDQGFGSKTISAETIRSVLALTDAHIQDLWLFDLDQRLQAVEMFKAKPEAAALTEANKRIYNILSKNNALEGAAKPTVALFAVDEERKLYQAAESVNQLRSSGHADYAPILNALATLAGPLEQFFNQVMVMVDDVDLKNNRLALLRYLRKLFLKVADIRLLG